jgi:hypothetical protein
MIVDCCFDIVDCCAELIDSSYVNNASVKNTPRQIPTTIKTAMDQSLSVVNFDSARIATATAISDMNVPARKIGRTESGPNQPDNNALKYVRPMAI